MNQKKDHMLASVSHDIRTPLNSLVSILNLVLEMLDSSQVKIKKYINLSINSASSLLFLVNDLLDSSQIENGKLNNLNFEKIDIQSLISPVMQLLKFPAKKKGVSSQMRLRRFPEDQSVCRSLPFSANTRKSHRERT